MRRFCPEVAFPVFPYVLPKDAPAKCNPKVVQLGPKVLTYVEGKPITKQEHIVVGSRPEVFDWANHMETAEAARQCTEDSVRSAIVFEIETLRRHTKCGRGDVHILRGGGDHRAKLRVVAARLLKKGDLSIASMVKHPMQVMK